MASNKELEAGARSIADDLQLPGGGSKKLARVVLNHLEWFDAAEARGMTWSDMIRLLSAAGASGKNGAPLSVGTLSSTVWRKRAKVKLKRETALQSARVSLSAKSGGAKRTETVMQNASARGTSAGDNRSSGERPREERAVSRKIASKTRNPKNATPAATRAHSATPQDQSPSKSDVLSFMNRAAAVRRRSEKD